MGTGLEKHQRNFIRRKVVNQRWLDDGLNPMREVPKGAPSGDFREVSPKGAPRGIPLVREGDRYTRKHVRKDLHRGLVAGSLPQDDLGRGIAPGQAFQCSPQIVSFHDLAVDETKTNCIDYCYAGFHVAEINGQKNPTRRNHTDFRTGMSRERLRL